MFNVIVVLMYLFPSFFFLFFLKGRKGRLSRHLFCRHLYEFAAKAASDQEDNCYSDERKVISMILILFFFFSHSPIPLSFFLSSFSFFSFCHYRSFASSKNQPTCQTLDTTLSPSPGGLQIS